MNTKRPELWRRCRRQSSLSHASILPDELIYEILSWLTVKLLMQMKCVSKSWKTIISDPKFVKMHLNRSARNPHILAVSSILLKSSKREGDYVSSLIHFPVSRLLEHRFNTVRVFSLGDNIWKTIQSFPVDTLPLLSNHEFCQGVYFSCTVYWLACRSDLMVNNRVQRFVISLDLGTETYTQMMLPQGLEENESSVMGNVCVLMNSLCFYHNLNETDLVIWKMTKFKDEKSWIQIVKFSYTNIQMTGLRLKPVHLDANGETLVLENVGKYEAIIYNLRTNKAKKARINNKMCRAFKEYVESMVSTS